MQTQALIDALILVLYLIVARHGLAHMQGFMRQVFFAALNLAGIFYFLCAHKIAAFMAYWLVVSLLYLPFRTNLCSIASRTWLIFSLPLLALAAIRYVVPHWAHLSADSNLFMFVGFSYLAFRCSRLALEIRNGLVQRPSYLEFLNFAFFLPTMYVGPINTYANYSKAFNTPIQIPIFSATARILVGLIKYFFIGGVLGYLTYHSLLLNGNYHPWVHLPIAMIAYYLFLYCNFSGFCDMAIGAAAIVGIAVPENFDNPLLARNMREFWNRWHITLSQWMRDILFAPLSKSLVGKMGPAYASHAIAITIFVVFLIVGIWHGVGWNYVLFGLAQALGVTTSHYYNVFLKSWLGREKFKTYNENRFIHAVAVVITFFYFAFSLFFFANTMPEMKQILGSLR
jgi:D-alanyl-lipoteichoic acid acyltransferase DltB (MBOAT superfamily)